MDAERSTVSGSQDSNHWNSWGDQDKEIRLNIGPDMKVLAWALNAMLGETLFGPSAGRFKFAVDLTGAVSRPNMAEDARQGAELAAVNPKGVRALAGIPEDFAPEEDELVRMVGWKMNNPLLALYGLPIADGIDWDEVAKIQGKSSPGPKGDSSEPGSKGPESPKPSKPTPESDRPKSKTPA
jgi:hypothetical protein